jgi:two-component system nitrogen regulation sensor histidine kinase NtrY
LLNAAEAIEGRDGEKLPPGEITTRITLEDGAVYIEIEDNGKGLPANQRDRLTEPYFTTRSKGTGLGLAIVHKIMEDHKGSLHLTDSPAGGAIVRLHLIGDPITDATDSDVQGENPLSR